MNTRENKFLYVFFSGLSVLSLIWLTWNTFHPANDVPGCLFRFITGIPCPSCGITHSMSDIVQFHFTEALQENILGFPATALLAIVPILIVTDFVFQRRNFIRCYRGMESVLQQYPVLSGILAILVIANWVFLILQH